MQLLDPGSLWPPVQGEQESVAPVLKVLRGQSSVAVRSEFVLKPEATVVQYEEPLEE